MLAFLKRLRRACKSLETVNDWLELTEDLAQLLVTHREGLTEEQRERLERAMKASKLAERSLQLACKALQGEVERVIRALPVGLLGLTPAAWAVIGVVAVVGVGVIVGGVTVWRQAQRGLVLEVVNAGCPPLALGRALPAEWKPTLARLGTTLPDEVPTDSRAILRLPVLPTTLRIDATRADTLTITLTLPSGEASPFQLDLAPEVDSILLDDTPLLGNTFLLPLDQPQERVLVIHCTAP